jgi:hypothetical protein
MLMIMERYENAKSHSASVCMNLKSPLLHFPEVFSTSHGFTLLSEFLNIAAVLLTSTDSSMRCVSVMTTVQTKFRLLMRRSIIHDSIMLKFWCTVMCRTPVFLRKWILPLLSSLAVNKSNVAGKNKSGNIHDYTVLIRAGIATDYGMDDRGVEVRAPVGLRIFTSPSRPNRLWGPHNLLFNGYRGLFRRGLKRAGREADHSPPTRAEV